MFTYCRGSTQPPTVHTARLSVAPLWLLLSHMFPSALTSLLFGRVCHAPLEQRRWQTHSSSHTHTHALNPHLTCWTTCSRRVHAGLLNGFLITAVSFFFGPSSQQQSKILFNPFFYLTYCFVESASGIYFFESTELFWEFCGHHACIGAHIFSCKKKKVILFNLNFTWKVPLRFWPRGSKTKKCQQFKIHQTQKKNIHEISTQSFFVAIQESVIVNIQICLEPWCLNHM